MRFIVFLSLLLSCGKMFAQSAYFVDPNWQYFYVFNEEELHKAEFLPIVQAEAGADYVAYIRNNNRFIIFTNGESLDVNITNPRFFARDNLLAYFVDEQLWVLHNGKPKLLEKWAMDDFTIGDDILSFTNNFDKFMIYQEDSLYTVELWGINQAKAGDNLIAYLDNNNNFKVFYYGIKETLDNIPPLNFKVSKDIVAYVDYLGQFKVWNKGDQEDLLYPAPVWYQCGENFVAYVDNLGSFSVYFNGEAIELLTYKPMNIQIKDNVMTYTDDFGFLYAYYMGVTKRICSYNPEVVKLDNDIVVYKDIYGYLKGLYKGKLTDFSKEIAIDFEVFNHTVVYKPDKVKWVVFNNGKYYNYP
jgi:hypothetical protein